MHIVRYSLAALLILSLSISFLCLALSSSIKLSLSSPQKVTGWLNQSINYQSLVSEVASTATPHISIPLPIGATSITLTEARLTGAIKAAFPSAQLHSAVSQFVAGNYTWLEEKTTIPSFSLNLLPDQTALTEALQTDITGKLTTLLGWDSNPITGANRVQFRKLRSSVF
jgi:hypothetical protein